VIQEAGLFPHFTVSENVALVPSLEKWGAPASSNEPEALDLASRRGTSDRLRESSGGASA
jgi:ABC-type proline/glycine betaine transport system ATPase subunit